MRISSAEPGDCLPACCLPGLPALLVPTACRSPRTDHIRPVPAAAVANAVPVASPDYPVVFPDVLELNVAGKPECSGRRLVYPDGRIDLGPHGAVFAEGCTAAEITRRVAAAAGVSAQDVRCQVAQARSRFVYVLGPGADRPRAVPYAGPEGVSDLLARAGGVSPGSHLADVRVVRRNVARGLPTETFHVDLAAVKKGRRSHQRRPRAERRGACHRGPRRYPGRILFRPPAAITIDTFLHRTTTGNRA